MATSRMTREEILGHTNEEFNPKNEGENRGKFRGYEALALSHGGTEDYMPRTLISRKLGLDTEQGRAVLTALAKSTLESPRLLVDALKAHADRRSLAGFAWTLFERWLAENAPPNKNWAMAALGLLGSNGAALKLAPMVGARPCESQHQRAVLGLHCLRDIGTDAALMQLNGIARKLPFKAHEANATALMEAIAEDRGRRPDGRVQAGRAHVDPRRIPPGAAGRAGPRREARCAVPRPASQDRFLVPGDIRYNHCDRAEPACPPGRLGVPAARARGLGGVGVDSVSRAPGPRRPAG
jgi:hypothetical protein